jgi:hypothetical protein
MSQRTDTLLSREIDDLLLQARGLVLVRRILAERGASAGELDAHRDELDRVRRRLAEAIRGRPLALGDAA